MLCDIARRVIGEHLACGVPYGYEKAFTHPLRLTRHSLPFATQVPKGHFAFSRLLIK